MLSPFPLTGKIKNLMEPDFLSPILGAVEGVQISDLVTPGHSGSLHKKLIVTLSGGKTISLVMKTIHPEMDVTIRRTGALYTREALLLDSRALDDIWNFFESPYIAYAKEETSAALLMHDLSDYIVPDKREPVTIEQETDFISLLAKFHVRYLGSPVLNHPWLTSEVSYFRMFGPYTWPEENIAGHMRPLYEMVGEGWNFARTILPSKIQELLWKPAINLVSILDGLPRTLIHGDSKVGNFAFMPSHKIAAFDWSLIGAAPSSCEIGWYLAVNATRLARSKEDVLKLYRSVFESELGQQLTETSWSRFKSAGILSGSLSMLWKKALNVKQNLPGAQDEWNWWEKELDKCRVDFFSK